MGVLGGGRDCARVGNAAHCVYQNSRKRTLNGAHLNACAVTRLKKKTWSRTVLYVMLRSGGNAFVLCVSFAFRYYYYYFYCAKIHVT